MSTKNDCKIVQKHRIVLLFGGDSLLPIVLRKMYTPPIQPPKMSPPKIIGEGPRKTRVHENGNLNDCKIVQKHRIKLRFFTVSVMWQSHCWSGPRYSAGPRSDTFCGHSRNDCSQYIHIIYWRRFCDRSFFEEQRTTNDRAVDVRVPHVHHLDLKRSLPNIEENPWFAELLGF